MFFHALYDLTFYLTRKNSAAVITAGRIGNLGLPVLDYKILIIEERSTGRWSFREEMNVEIWTQFARQMDAILFHRVCCLSYVLNLHMHAFCFHTRSASIMRREGEGEDTFCSFAM
jgi:hypothetical protein